MREPTFTPVRGHDPRIDAVRDLDHHLTKRRLQNVTAGVIEYIAEAETLSERAVGRAAFMRCKALGERLTSAKAFKRAAMRRDK